MKRFDLSNQDIVKGRSRFTPSPSPAPRVDSADDQRRDLAILTELLDHYGLHLAFNSEDPTLRPADPTTTPLAAPPSDMETSLQTRQAAGALVDTIARRFDAKLRRPAAGSTGGTGAAPADRDRSSFGSAKNHQDWFREDFLVGRSGGRGGGDPLRIFALLRTPQARVAADEREVERLASLLRDSDSHEELLHRLLHVAFDAREKGAPYLARIVYLALLGDAKNSVDTEANERLAQELAAALTIQARLSDAGPDGGVDATIRSDAAAHLVQVKSTPRGRGRPAGDKTLPVLVRLHPSQMEALDAWIERQNDPKPSRPEAIRDLMWKGLLSTAQ